MTRLQTALLLLTTLALSAFAVEMHGMRKEIAEFRRSNELEELFK